MNTGGPVDRSRSGHYWARTSDPRLVRAVRFRLSSGFWRVRGTDVAILGSAAPADAINVIVLIARMALHTCPT